MSYRRLAIGLVLAVLVPIVTVPAPAAEAAPNKVTVCHRTRSTTNPYRRISVSQSALTSNAGHKNHTGGLWVEGTTSDWGDIVPDATGGGSTSTALNFTEAGKAIWDGTTKSLGRAACRYQNAKEFYDLQKAAGQSDVEIVEDLNAQKANEDLALLDALGGSFTVDNISLLNVVSATTAPASDVDASAATLHGSISLGAGTTAGLSFVYGQSPDLSAGSLAVDAEPASFTATATVGAAEASVTLTDLAPATTYYYKAVGTTNAGTDIEGTIEGGILSVTTPGASAQVITFPQPPAAMLGTVTSVSPTSSSGLPVTLTTTTPSSCAVSGLTITLIAAGTCTVTASQAGDGTWDRAEPVTRSFAVTEPEPADPETPVTSPEPAVPGPTPPDATTPPGTPPAPGAPPAVTAPPAPQGAVESRSATSDTSDGRAETAVGPLAGAALGAGGLTVSRLPQSSHDHAPGAAEDGYYHVAITDTGDIRAVELRLNDPSATSLFWWDGDAWRKVQGTTANADTGELVATITADTSPSLSHLAALELAAGATPTARLAGSDRTETAVAASQEAYPEHHSAAAAVLARDDVYADALTGGPLAAALSAPLLLSNRAVLPDSVAAELQRVLPPHGTVYLLGGVAALSGTVAASVSELGYPVVRIAGPDRFDTAVQIAHALGEPDLVFEATGLDFPDAMSAGPAAIAAGGAVLLTAGRQQSAATRDYLAGRHLTRYSVGGQAAAADPDAIALAGADRYSTSAMVADRFFTRPERVGIALGGDFPDSLVAAPYLGRTGQPLLLVRDGSSLPEPVRTYLQRHSTGILHATVFGGPAAVSEEVLTAVRRSLP